MIAGFIDRRPRLANWLYGFTPPERGTVILVHRRVYIVPARLGWIFGATLAILLIGSINYALSLGFALTFLLTGMGLAGMVHTARNLARLAVSAGRAEPVFAGESAQFRLYLDGRAAFDRPAILARHLGSGAQLVVDIPAGALAEVVLAVPAKRRGWLPLGRVMLETRFPLGLFRSWSYVEPDARCLVYPRPERSPLPPSGADTAAGTLRSPVPGNDDFAGLRGYQLSDSPRHVAWKAVARSDTQYTRSDDMLTKQFTGEAAAELWLDWRLLPAGLDLESRLSRLAGWVLAAEREGAQYGLRLPGVEIAPERGDAHRTACLQALALYEEAAMSAAAHPLAPEARAVSARDLAWLIGSLLLVIAPHSVRAPWWLTTLTLCLFAWRYSYALARVQLPSRWLVFGVAALGMLGVWIEYRTLFGRQPGILLLSLFAGLKLLETRSHRDAAVAAFLGYFLIITNFLYTQSMPTALLMCAALFSITTTLIGFSAPQRAPQANARTAALLLAHAAPAALVLFLLFPRVQGPLWGLPQDAYTGMTGLSETMSPGNLASLAQSDAIAFRAEFESDLPPPALRYWRGPVLWDFDGRTWSIGPGYLVDFDPPQGGRATYRYAVVLEAHNRHWLFALETAASLPERARMRFDGQLISTTPVRSRMRYQLASVIAPAQAEESEGVLRRALRLPARANPRAVELAAQWRAGATSDEEVLIRAIDFLKAGNYAYTLEPPLLGLHSVDEFLFSTKAGFCEHFASAFTFLMRAAGIPARVVTGYQGGELNPIDRVFTVRQSEAHAWVEVYLGNRGWVRVDPTGAAVPGRIESGLARSVPAGEPLPLMMQPRLEWLRGVRYQWEALAHKWNLWVLGYSPERQRDLMSAIGMRDADWRALTASLFSILGLITLGLLAWSLRYLARQDPVQKAWGAFCGKLAAHGVKRAPHEGPRDYALRAARTLPSAAWTILRISALYIALRYGARARAKGVERLKRLVRGLRLA